MVSLVAALHIYPKVVPCSPQTCEPGMALHIFAHKNAVLIPPALVERTRLDTRLQQFRVDTPALQVSQHYSGEPAGLWDLEGLPGLRGWPFLGRRGTIAAQGLHRPHKVHPPDLEEIVQRSPAPNALAVPAPLSVGDFQTVVGPAAVFVGATPF